MLTPVHCQNSQQQMQYGKKASQRRRRDALGSALLGNLPADITAELQGSNGVHALMGQGSFGRKRGTNTILGIISSLIGV